MSKRDIIKFLFKWKFSLIGYFILVVALVTVLVYLLPQKYTAAASVLIESNREPNMRTDAMFGMDQMSVLNSEISIIRSSTVLSQTADKVGYGMGNEPPGFVQEMISNVFEWMESVGLKEPMTPRAILIRKLDEKLDVQPQPNSNVITISINDKNPGRATDIVNTVTDAFIDHHLKIFSSKGTSEVFRRQLERLERELVSKRQGLESYKRKTRVSAIEDTMLVMVQDQRVMSSDLSDAKEELTELKTQYDSGHTKVLLLNEKISNLNSSLNQVQAELRELEMVKAKIDELEAGIASIDSSYQQYKKRYEEERLNDLATPDVVNVRVIEYAEVPTRPNHSRIFYIILAVAGGFFLSFAIALIREYFDHNVDIPDDVAHILGFPSLGSVERL